MQKQRGRPQIPKEKRVTQKVTILLTDEEKEYLTKVAKEQDMSISQYVREVLKLFRKISQNQEVMQDGKR